MANRRVRFSAGVLGVLGLLAAGRWAFTEREYGKAVYAYVENQGASAQLTGAWQLPSSRTTFTQVPSARKYGKTVYYFIENQGYAEGSSTNIGQVYAQDALVIDASLKDYNAMTPVEFVKLTQRPTTAQHPYVHFWGECDLPSGGRTTSPTDAFVKDPKRYLLASTLQDGDKAVLFTSDGTLTGELAIPSESLYGGSHLFIHETGHTLGGRDHEQQRYDRDDSVTFSSICATPWCEQNSDAGLANCCDADSNTTDIPDCPTNGTNDYIKRMKYKPFAKTDTRYNNLFDELTPFDAKSMMLYASSAQCLKGAKRYDDAGTVIDACACYPLLGKASLMPTETFTVQSTYLKGQIPDLMTTIDGNGPNITQVMAGQYVQTGGRYEGNASFSAEDFNWLYLAFPPTLGTNGANEALGTSLAAADFDGDTYTDLAVGAPNDETGDGVYSGAVYLYKGTNRGLVPWMRFTQKDIGTRVEGDKFGKALAAGDLDGDGYNDLVIGTPGKNQGAGAIYILKGTRYGLATGTSLPLYLEQGSLGLRAVPDATANDGFGKALAVADFDGDGKRDVAVGAPGKYFHGVVYILSWASGSLTGSQMVGGALEAGGALGALGSVLATGDLNGDSKYELLIGAPSAASGAGRVYAYWGSSTGLGATTTTFSPPLAVSPPLLGQVSGFGTSVAWGMVGDQQRYLVVGQPGGPGRVWLLTVGSSGSVTASQKIDSPSSGDGFGSAVAIDDLNDDRSADLIVGAPERNSRGGVTIYKGQTGTTLPTAWNSYGWQADNWSTTQSADKFGSVLAVGKFSYWGSAHVAIGAPGYSGDKNGAGSFFVLQSSSLTPAWTTEKKLFTSHFSQETSVPRTTTR